MNFKRVFLIVLDSVGVGEAIDANIYGDIGCNTIKHVAEKTNLFIPNLTKLGFLNTLGMSNSDSLAYYTTAKPSNHGKDSLDGHYEMMGVLSDDRFNLFTETGFPMDLIKTIEVNVGRRVIGNVASDGNDIIQQLGEMQMKSGALIIYTSADSVLQVAANKNIIPIEELYKDCEIIRKIVSSNPKWNVARVIARPFIGEHNGEFVRTLERRDYTLDPPQRSVLDFLKEDKYDVISIGKIYDLFNGNGITKRIVSNSNKEAVDKLLSIMDRKFNGLCFVNLNDFDSLYGHRRDVNGYARAIESFDVDIPVILTKLNNDDLLIITADHGNDPTFKGSDHTRENLPVIVYSRIFNNTCKIPDLQSLGDIGATISDIFDVQAPGFGESFLERLK